MTIVVTISVLSIKNSFHFMVKDYEVKLPKKDSQIEHLNLVYLSDMHYGTCVNNTGIDAIVTKTNELDADLLILGVDIFDEGTLEEDKKFFVEKLSSFEMCKVIMYTEGNHEYSSIHDNIDEEMSYFENSTLWT